MEVLEQVEQLLVQEEKSSDPFPLCVPLENIKGFRSEEVWSGE